MIIERLDEYLREFKGNRGNWKLKDGLRESPDQTVFSEVRRSLGIFRATVEKK